MAVSQLAQMLIYLYKRCATIKENITFKFDYDKDWYQRAVDSRTLTPHFEDFPTGDEIQISESGSKKSEI